MTEPFPHYSEMKVRWRDIDVLGHVNNAVYFTYFETARVEYMERAFPRRDFDLHLVSASCEFLLPLHRGDVARVGVRVPWVGRTSFAFAYEICLADDPDRLVARGTSVQVVFDRGGGGKRTIKPDWLAAVAQVEGRPPPKPPQTRRDPHGA